MKIEFLTGSRDWLKNNLGDAISATASNGFTVLGAISSKFNWDANLIDEAINKCNELEKVLIVNQVSPTLLLVPKTRGEKSVEGILMGLIDASNSLELKELRFSHYASLSNKLPRNEITEIIKFLSNPNLKTTLEKIYWDIDEEFKNQVEEIYNNFN
jgi:hypothetical protein